MKKNTRASLLEFLAIILLATALGGEQLWAGEDVEKKVPAPGLIQLNQLQNLYAEVQFDHEFHAEGYECAACHHTGSSTAGPNAAEKCMICHQPGQNQENRGPKIGPCRNCHPSESPPSEDHLSRPNRAENKILFHLDIPMLLGAYHLQCLGCHRDEGVPSGCSDCHLLNQKGRYLFQLPQK
jgi:hypothetical protein